MFRICAFACDLYICGSPYGISVFMCNMQADTCAMSVYIHMYEKQSAVVFAEQTVSMKYFSFSSLRSDNSAMLHLLKMFQSSSVQPWAK